MRSSLDVADAFNAATEGGVELELDQLSPEALRGLVEEFITREGTDYGEGVGGGPTGGSGSLRDRDWTLEEKVAQIQGQLERGEAKIVFDLDLGSASIVSAT